MSDTADFNFYINQEGPRGPKGEKGDKGFSPNISVYSDTLSEYILKITNENGFFLTTNLREHKEDRGGTYIRYDRSTGAQYAGSADQASETAYGEVRFATQQEVDTASESTVISPANMVDYLNANVVPELTQLMGDVTNLKTSKQDKLTAGENITIIDNVISATGGGGTGDVTAVGDNTFTGTNTFNGTTVVNSGLFKVTTNPNTGASARVFNPTGGGPSANKPKIGGEDIPVYLDGSNVLAVVDTDEGVATNVTMQSIYDAAMSGGVDAYTKQETDDLLLAKQDLLTPVNPITVKKYAKNPVAGATYSEDGLKVYQSFIPTNSWFVSSGGDLLFKTKNIDNINNPFPSYIAMPFNFGNVYTLGWTNVTDDAGGYSMANPVYLCKVTDSGKVIPIVMGRNTMWVNLSDTDYELTSNNQAIHFNSKESVDTSYSTISTTNELCTTGCYQVRDTGTTIQIIEFTKSSTSVLKRVWNFSDPTQVARIRECNAVYLLPSQTVAGDPYFMDLASGAEVSKIGRYEYSGTLSETTQRADLGENLFNASKAIEYTYLELNTDSTLKVANNLLTVGSTVTTQGNTFNGPSQLVQLGSDGKLPAIDGSKLTNVQASTPTNMVTTNTQQEITASKQFNEGIIIYGNNKELEVNGGGGASLRLRQSGNNSYIISDHLSFNDGKLFIQGDNILCNRKVGTGAGSNLINIDSGNISDYASTIIATGLQPVNTLLKVDVTGLNITVDTGTTNNLLDSVSLTGSTTNVVTVANILATNFNLTGGILKLPYMPTVDSKYKNAYCDYTIDVRLTGSIAGSVNTAREFNIELQRGSDNSIVETHNITKTNTNDLTGKGVAFSTYTNGSTDPFIADGLKLVLNNTSGQTVTITGITILVKGRTY